MGYGDPSRIRSCVEMGVEGERKTMNDDGDDDNDDCVSAHHHCESRERYESGRVGSNKGKIDINQDRTG